MFREARSSCVGGSVGAPVDFASNGENLGEQRAAGGSKYNRNRPYVSRFKDNRLPVAGALLEYMPTEGDEIELSFDDIDPVEKVYGHCLIGCVVGRLLNGYNVKEVVRMWGVNVKFQFHDNGWITFTFTNEDDLDRILYEGPYLVAGHYLFLKKIPSLFMFREEDKLIMPSWVQFHGLPLDCWTNMALSKIASVVGNPIHMDKMTSSRSRTKFARVFIEIDVSKDRIRDLTINLPTGMEALIQLVYEAELKLCTFCNATGHTFKDCFNSRRSSGDDDGQIKDDREGMDGGRPRLKSAAPKQSMFSGRSRHSKTRNHTSKPPSEWRLNKEEENLEKLDTTKEFMANDEQAEIGNTKKKNLDKGKVQIMQEGKWIGSSNVVDEDGYTTAGDKGKKGEGKQLKNAPKKGPSHSESMETEFVECDVETDIPLKNGKMVFMKKNQAEGRRPQTASGSK